MSISSFDRPVRGHGRIQATALFTVSLLAVLLLLPDQPLAQQRQRAGGMSTHQTAQRLLNMSAFEADLRFISSDLTEGRAPAGRGEAITVEYIEARLRMAGAEGAFEGGAFRQPVPLVVQRASSEMELRIAGRGSEKTFAYGNEFVLDSGVFEPTVTAEGEIIFVGYGAVAPEYNWDDYKGVDVRGKVLMMLVNDPPATENEPTLWRHPGARNRHGGLRLERSGIILVG
jgi:hypothetical protein